MEIVLLAVVGVVVLVVVAWGVWRGATSPPGPPRPEPWTEGATTGRTIVLDIVVADPADPAVQRLVREAGHHALRAEPELDEVEIRARDGTVLGRVRRPEPLKDIELPETLHEPHVAHHRGPSAVPPGRVTRPTVSREAVEDEPTPRHRDFADRFELAPRIEQELRQRDDPVELVRAILASAGKQVVVEGDRLVVDDLAIVVVSDLLDRATEALNHAFHRCVEAGVRRGLVIRLGWVNAEELRRREAAAPWIRHVDADAIQRMADAVALGGDPVAFAAGPRVVG